MDGKQFDQFAQRLASAPSRRSLLKGLAGATLATALGIRRVTDADAACRKTGETCRDHGTCCSGVCGPKDRAGRRTCACPSGTTSCRGTCVTPTTFQSDVNNCGSCGHRCPRTTCDLAACTAGVCGLAPDPKAAGKAACAPKDCSVFTDQCNDGVYDSASKACVKRPKANGSACDDDNACTRTDTCQNGVCVGGNPVVCTKLDQCHVKGTCNPDTGVCSNPDAPNGTTCNDGNACTTGDTCQSGVCTGGASRVCDSDNPCLIDSCDPVSGCIQTAKKEGTPCADDDRCDGDEVCDGAGTCVAGTPVTCGPPADAQCQEAGICDSETGVCSYANKADGTTCTLANQCFGSASCQQGVCTGADPVICTASGQCHAAGVCDPATGLCSNPNVQDGTACQIGDLCVVDSTCTSGVCGGGKAKECNDDNACTTDSCSRRTGECVNTPKVCNDNNVCTTDSCNTKTGECVFTPISCDDGDPCTIDTCDEIGGVGCIHTPVTCPPPGQCQTGGVCDSQTGLCTYGNVEAGMACVLPNAYGICFEGTCRLVVCDYGYSSCNGMESDGCETAVFVDNINHCGGCGVICQAVDDCTPARCDNGICNQTSNCTGNQTCGGGGSPGSCGVSCTPPSQMSTYAGGCYGVSRTCTSEGMILRGTCFTGSSSTRNTSINVNSCASADYVISNCDGYLTCGSC